MATSGILGTLLQVVLVLCVIAFIWWLIGYLGLPDIVQKIATVILAILAVVYLLQAVFPGVI